MGTPRAHTSHRSDHLPARGTGASFGIAAVGIGDTLAAKIRASLTYYRSLLTVPGCEVRLHDTTLYNSLFRYDDTLLANPHVYGQPASANPILHLKWAAAGGWFDDYARSFDAVWAGARPWAPEQEETHGQD